MYASASVQMGRLQEPQVVPIKVVQGEVMLGSCPLLEVESLEFSDFVASSWNRAGVLLIYLGDNVLGGILFTI